MKGHIVWRFLRKRLLYSALALLGLTFAVFVLAYLNGSPARLYLPEGAPQSTIDTFNQQHGYNLPFYQQFGSFLRNLAHFDFGQSLSQGRPASAAILEAFPATIQISVIALAISVVVGVTLGCIAAMKPFGPADRTITILTLGSSSFPDFWLALMCVLFFSVRLGILPTSGQSGLSSWILPVLTLALAPIGGLAQVARGAMVESLGAGYIQNARARGYSRSRLTFRHALKNASLPIVSVAGNQAAHMFNGTVIISVVFAWPGVGGVMLGAVGNRDFPILQAGVFLVGLAIIVLNIGVDLTYSLIDPRIRVS
jgi:peptide/nickel transport system permease protein